MWKGGPGFQEISIRPLSIEGTQWNNIKKKTTHTQWNHVPHQNMFPHLFPLPSITHHFCVTTTINWSRLYQQHTRQSTKPKLFFFLKVEKPNSNAPASGNNYSSAEYVVQSLQGRFTAPYLLFGSRGTTSKMLTYGGSGAVHKAWPSLSIINRSIKKDLCNTESTPPTFPTSLVSTQIVDHQGLLPNVFLIELSFRLT